MHASGLFDALFVRLISNSLVLGGGAVSIQIGQGVTSNGPLRDCSFPTNRVRLVSLV